MIISFNLFIPFLFLSADSSSIRERSFKNELVPFLSSRLDPLKKDSNSLKIVSNEPFIIQLQMPNSVERGTKRSDEKDKKRKRPAKKRVSKIKRLGKKHRTRRDLLTSKTKPRQEKSNQSEIPHAANATERQLNNVTKNSINRMEILKALSSYSKIMETKRSKLEGNKNVEKNNIERAKHNIIIPNRNLHKHHSLLSDSTPYVKMVYPNTPKFDDNQHKYTYRDLLADRERLEQKIKYIKNMLNANDTAADDTIRIRRRSDSDRTANKIAKMFLTLSAVNGLHDRRKSKCDKEDEEEIWDKGIRNNLSKKSSSSNEERYKVKKWIEFMKNKRSSSKTCPCMTNANGEEGDVFPLEQKLSNGLKEREINSEESSESYSEPFYYPRDKLNNNSKKLFLKNQEQENKIKSLTRNGKKKLELPLNDLELYRSRAKQILQNAEEILDRIKEEEERRLSEPNSFMNQLKELTSRIQTDPRNNENDLIQKIQKNLGWGPLAKSKESTDENNFIDNVKSFILNPYEKAKALTDESTKRLSSYLLRNLGKLQESSEEENEERENDEKTTGGNLQVYFEQIPQKEEEKPVSASLAKEPTAEDLSKNKKEMQNSEDTFSVVVGEEAKNKENNSSSDQVKPFKQKMKDIIKEQKKKLDEYQIAHNLEENNQEKENSNDEQTKFPKLEKEAVRQNKLENLGEEGAIELKDEVNKDDQQKTDIESSKSNTAKETENSDFVEKKKNPQMVETFQEKKHENGITTSGNMPEEKEFEKEIEENLKNKSEKNKKFSSDEEETNNDKTEKESAKNTEIIAGELEEPKFGQERSKEQEQRDKEKSQKLAANTQETSLEEKVGNFQNMIQKEREENILLSPHSLFDEESLEKSDENLKMAFEESSNGSDSNAETLSKKEEKSEIKADEEDLTKLDQYENNFMQNIKEFSDTSQNSQETLGLNDSSGHGQGEIHEDNEQTPSNDEVIQLKNSKKTPENADLVQETNHELKELSEGSYLISTESSLKSEEQSNEEKFTLKSEVDNEDEVNNKKTESNTLKAVLDTEGDEKKLQERLIEGESRTSLDEQGKEYLNESDDKKNPSFEKSDDLENQESFDRANKDDNQLKAENPKSRENEASESKNQAENENGGTTLKLESPTEEISYESLDKSTVGDVNTESALEEKNLYIGTEVSNEEDGEISLRTAVTSQVSEKNSHEKEDNNNEANEKPSNSNEERSNETFFKTTLNENKDFDKRNFDETPIEATNPNQKVNENDDDEAQNSLELGDKTFLKAEQNEKTISEEGGEILKSLKVTDDVNSQEENQKNERLNKEYSNETSLKLASNKKNSENLEEVGDATSTEFFEDKEAESLKETDKVTSISINPQPENVDENRSQEMPLRSSSELNNEKSEENTLNELNLDQSQESQSSENKDEKENDKKLKPGDNHNQENLKEDNDEVHLRKSSKNFHEDMSNQKGNLMSNEDVSDETVEAVLDEKTSGEVNEASLDETLKEAKLNEESEQKQENNEEINLRTSLKEVRQNIEGTDDNETGNTKSKESERKQGNSKNSNEDSVEVILENQERETETANDETDLTSNENKSSQNENNSEEEDDNGKLLIAGNPSKNENNQINKDNKNTFEEGTDVTTLRVGLESQDRESSEEMHEEILEKNLREDLEKKDLSHVEGDRTPLVGRLEDEWDNKIDVETSLSSTKASEVKNGQEFLEGDKSEETLRTETTSDNLNNQIDPENENPSTLKSAHFDEEFRKRYFEGNDEILKKENPLDENLRVKEDEDQLKAGNLINQENSPDPQEEQNHSSSDLLQKSGSTAKPSKTGILKVPKSIGKIMEDLEGKEKDDITSIQNLNPDKIDHIIYKIDEAEQQNLIQSQETDCRKQCACADEIHTKSKNIGRYEIVKDFLHWMKDLQLNRVLSDD